MDRLRIWPYSLAMFYIISEARDPRLIVVIIIIILLGYSFPSMLIALACITLLKIVLKILVMTAATSTPFAT